MTERIQEFLRNRRNEGQDTEPCLVVDLDVVRDNFQAFAKALPDTRIFYAVKANPAPEILRCSPRMGSSFDTALGRRDRDGAGRRRDRRTASPSATPSRRSATSRAPSRSASACSPSTASRKSRRSPAPHPARGVLPRAHRRRGRRMAAVAQVRLRARRWPSTCCARQGLGLDAYGVSFHVGSQQSNLNAWDRALAMPSASSRLRRARHRPEDGQHGRRLPDPLPEGRAGGASLRPGDLLGAAQAFRQRASRRPSSSRAAAWSAMPASSSRRSC